jgi:tripeptide aminopeptidase
VKVALICCIFFWMAPPSVRVTEDSVSRLADDPRCARGLAWIAENTSWVTDQQIRLTEIPAPEFGEGRRAAALKDLFAASQLQARIDRIGNVVAERTVGDGKDSSDAKSVILIAAHLDTVFPVNTDVRVKRESTRLLAPGISDNGAGLAALVGLARALAESGVRTEKTIALAGDVGEEGEGNLRGIRALVEAYGPRLAAVIAVDGPSSDHITTQAIASRRIEVDIDGPGGHSWSDFGVPNPITAISRGIVRFSSISIPGGPRSTYNFGFIEGGTSVNSIPSHATVKVDLRSEEERELAHLESTLRQAMQLGVNDEVSTTGATDDALRLTFRLLGTRPAGKLPDDSPLLATIRSVDRYVGNVSRLEKSSTDANLPLSLGIPAVAIGGGGKGGGSHTSEEWYDPSGREIGLKRLFLTAVSLAGVER